jgi:hypothetical protein
MLQPVFGRSLSHRGVIATILCGGFRVEPPNHVYLTASTVQNELLEETVDYKHR